MNFFSSIYFLSYFFSSLINCVISYHFIVFLKLTVFLRSDGEKGQISAIKDSETDVLSHFHFCVWSVLCSRITELAIEPFSNDCQKQLRDCDCRA